MNKYISAKISMINVTATVNNILLMSKLIGKATGIKTMFKDMVLPNLIPDCIWKENLIQVRWKEKLS